MNDTKPFVNLIKKRRSDIVIWLNNFFPQDIAELISKYDYHLEGISYTFNGHKSAVSCIGVIPDGNEFRLVSGSYDGTIKIWNLQTGECDITFEIDASLP
jgi:WD40 repeat protein